MLKNITYKVVVIDDDEDFYEDYTEIIEKKLNKEGYLLNKNRYEELSELNNNDISDVDLFLVDLKFGNEDKGQEFISKIRENYFTDILFYSSDAKSIMEKRKSGDYQGVFFAVRDEHKNEIKVILNKLIDKMLMRSNAPIATRGIVLSCVAEIDNLIKAKIVTLIKKMEPAQQKELENHCVKIFRESYKGNFKKTKEFFGVDFHKGLKELDELTTTIGTFDIEKLSRDIDLTNSNKNLKILTYLYKKIVGKDETYNTIKKIESLLGDRNILAHVEEEVLAGGEYGFKKPKEDGYLILSANKCVELRKCIADYAKAVNLI